MIIKAYHISRTKNRESIFKNGLIPHEKDFGIIKYEPRIFISTDDKDLGFDFVDYENVDCWQFNVDSKEIKPDIFSGSTNHFYINTTINPSELKILKIY